MRKLAFVLLAVFLLWPPPALAGAVRGTIPPPPANASGLWNFAGFWRLNLEKSRPLVAPETVVWLEEMKGFRFFLDALGGRARMEWPGTEPKNRRIEAVKVEGLKAQCRLEGFERMVRLERIGRDELRVTDGDEALVFERGK